MERAGQRIQLMVKCQPGNYIAQDEGKVSPGDILMGDMASAGPLPASLVEKMNPHAVAGLAFPASKLQMVECKLGSEELVHGGPDLKAFQLSLVCASSVSSWLDPLLSIPKELVEALP